MPKVNSPVEPTLEEIRAEVARGNQCDELLDSLDRVRWQIQFATGDDLAALLEEEASILRAIELEPFRYGRARGQLAIATAQASLAEIERLRRKADALDARAVETSRNLNSGDDIDRRVERTRYDQLQVEAKRLRDSANASERNNILLEPMRKQRERLAELADERTKLESALNNLQARGPGGKDEAQTQESIARHQSRLEEIASQIAAADQAIAEEESKTITLLDVHTWPERVRQEMIAGAYACRQGIQRRSARIGSI